MKLKYILIFCILLIANYSYPQKVYQFSYSNNEFEFAKLTISENCFKLESVFSMIKPKGDSSLYHFAQNSDGVYIAKKVSADDFIENQFFFFDYQSTDTLLKIDTVYHHIDTLINGFSCKKVMINYVRGGLDGRSAKVDLIKFIPLDTLVSTLYIAPIFNTITPFSFVSKKVLGLIIERKFPRIEYTVENEKVLKVVNENRIFTAVENIDLLEENFFKLPKTCRYAKTYLEFLDFASKELVNEIKEILQDN